MSLRHAVLASLLDGAATGYELSKRMDISVANFWHATQTQIYAELRRLESTTLVKTTEVAQPRRPTKRIFEITGDGREELRTFVARPSKVASVIKDALSVKVQAADLGNLEVIVAEIEGRRAHSKLRLAIYDDLVREFLNGRDEATYLATTRRVGPYLNLKRGRDFEAHNVDWYAWAADVLRSRLA